MDARKRRELILDIHIGMSAVKALDVYRVTPDQFLECRQAANDPEELRQVLSVRRQRMTQRTKTILIELIDRGETTARIQDRIPVSPCTISKYRKLRGVARHRSRVFFFRSASGLIYRVTHLSKFCKFFRLHQPALSSVWAGVLKQSNGWCKATEGKWNVDFGDGHDFHSDRRDPTVSLQ